MKGWRVRLRRPETRGDRELPPVLRVDRAPPKKKRWMSWLVPFILLAGVPSFVWVRSYGVVEARGRIVGRVVNVGTPFDGVLSSVGVSIGDVVTKGQEVARIDTDTFDAEVSQQRAQVAAAKAERERLAAEYDRNKSLARRGFESFEIAQASRLALVAADAGVKASQALLHAAEGRLRRAVIRSPISGVILWEPKQAGIVVTRDIPVVSVLDDRSLHIVAYVDELDRSKIRPGQEVQYTIDGFPDKTFTGKVSFLVRGVQARPASLREYDKPGETFQPVRITPDDLETMRALVSYGMRVNVKIKIR